MKSILPQNSRASFFRRLAAMVYDVLVAVAVGMCAGLVMMFSLLAMFELNIISKNGNEHFMDFFQSSFIYPLILQIWVALWVVGFFLWFWRNGGQTIGMRAWRLRLFSTTDKPFGYKRALLRLICSLGGVGTILVLFDLKSKQSLQDRLANTEILVLSKEDNHHSSWGKIQE
ncbi:MAG: putative RDD family membrane protein YckC [Patiriisocius sp.]